MPSKKGKDARPGKTARAPRGDDPASRGDRSKRLLDLVMILLRARMPVTYRDIREQFLAYQTLNIEAGLRAFERDKADLLELGVPIRYITPDEDDSLEDGDPQGDSDSPRPEPPTPASRSVLDRGSVLERLIRSHRAQPYQVGTVSQVRPRRRISRSAAAAGSRWRKSP